MKYLPEMQIDAPAPRWTPGSLAENVGRYHAEPEADAVERLTRAARAFLDAYDCGDCVQQEYGELDAAVEAAERWQR